MARAVKNADGSYSVKFEVTINGPENQVIDLISRSEEATDALGAGIEDFLIDTYGIHLSGRFVVIVEGKS